MLRDSFVLDVEAKEYNLNFWFHGFVYYVYFDSNFKMLPIQKRSEELYVQTFKFSNPPCYMLEIEHNKTSKSISLNKIRKMNYLNQSMEFDFIYQMTLKEAEKIVDKFLEEGTRKRDVVIKEEFTLEDAIHVFINEILEV